MTGVFPDWVWIVLWPANIAEPIWVFQSREDALVFTEGITDPVAMQREPVLDPGQVREMVAAASEENA